jgi:hypothetical protein
VPQPYDFAAAKKASESASGVQRQAEQFVIDASRRAANTERAYRKALSEKILELKAGGMAITACGDVARGDPPIADLKFERDVARGIREAASQAVWRATADRKDEGRFIEWSMRRDLAEGYGDIREPDQPEPVIGARA